ncbi:MAG: hypothetical protein IJA73_00930, partial [Oscillospiraceae bacterium]|nr:hypothetical protein [Oscillospiraceae bacterium]
MKRIFSVLLSLAMLLTMLPTAAMASTGTTHTLEDGGNLRALLADASVKDGDTIELLGTGHVNDPNSDSAPWIINKAVTITGGDISLRAGGILLGADVTFDGVELGFANRVRNAIMANGHTLTLRNVTAASGTLEFHLFCGGLTGHSETADAGTHGQVLVQGSSDVGSIYAGSLSANGAENSFALPATVTVAGGSTGEIYACGALETPVDNGKWFDTEYVPDPPTADREKYTVTGNVNISLSVPSATVDGAGVAAVQVSPDEGDAAAHTLTDIGSLVLAEGASLIPSAQSDLTG